MITKDSKTIYRYGVPIIILCTQRELNNLVKTSTGAIGPGLICKLRKGCLDGKVHPRTLTSSEDLWFYNSFFHIEQRDDTIYQFLKGTRFSGIVTNNRKMITSRLVTDITINDIIGWPDDNI